MSYTNVFVPAIVRLDPDSSEKVLVDLLAMAVSDRSTLGGLTQFLTQFDVSGSTTSL
jgi:hypothetical protein